MGICILLFKMWDLILGKYHKISFLEIQHTLLTAAPLGTMPLLYNESTYTPWDCPVWMLGRSGAWRHFDKWCTYAIWKSKMHWQRSGDICVNESMIFWIKADKGGLLLSDEEGYRICLVNEKRSWCKMSSLNKSKVLYQSKPIFE